VGQRQATACRLLERDDRGVDGWRMYTYMYTSVYCKCRVYLPVIAGQAKGRGIDSPPRHLDISKGVALRLPKPLSMLTRRMFFTYDGVGRLKGHPVLGGLLRLSCPCMYLAVYLSLPLSIYLSIYQSINRSINQSINQSIHLPIYLSIHISIYLSIYTLYVHMRICTL